MPSLFESQWLKFEPVQNSGKTAMVRVLSKTHGDVLGTIRWHGAWRCYAFFPAAATLFNVGCLEDIQAFIRELMAARTA